MVADFFATILFLEVRAAHQTVRKAFTLEAVTICVTKVITSHSQLGTVSVGDWKQTTHWLQSPKALDSLTLHLLCQVFR